jgi:hypothetical protein
MILTRINPKTKKEEIDDRDWNQMEYDIHFGYMDEPNAEQLKEKFKLSGKGCRI